MTGSKRAGYSLFEVLLAFAIMSMVLATLLPRQAQTLVRTEALAERLDAQDAALSHLAQIGLSAPILTGTRTLDIADWTLVERIQPHPLPDTTKEIVQITIIVEDPQGSELARLSELRVLP